MATQSSIIGSLQVNITAVTTKLEQGLRKARHLAGGFVEDIKASLVGSLAALPFAEALKHFVETGEEIEHLSQATGIAVEELSFLKYAAEQTGTGMDALTRAARGLIERGIDPSRFEEIATSIAGLQSPLQRAQAAMYYFGKRGAIGLVPLINNLPALKQRFEQLGGGLTEEMVKAAEKMGKSWGDLRLALSNIGNQIAFTLAPYVTKLSDYIADNGGAIRKWISNNTLLIKVLSGAATAVAILTPLLFVLKTALGLLNSSITGVVKAYGFFAGKPNLTAFSAIAAAAIDLTLILKDLENGAISAWQAIAQTGNALGGVGGFVPKAHFAASSITPDGTQPTSSSSEVAKNTARTADTMELLLAAMKNRGGDNSPPMPAAQPQAPPTPMAPFMIAPSGVR